jgi:hypothetical protein
MRAKEISSNVGYVTLENLWLRLALIFVTAPLFWLLLLYLLGQQIVLGWLVVAMAYVAMLIIGANANVTEREESHRRSEVF